MSKTHKNGYPIGVQDLGKDGHIHFSGVFCLPEINGDSQLIHWTAHDNHVYIPDIKNGNSHKWYDAINEYLNSSDIKTQLFNQILAAYRKQSSKSDGLFSAALSVTDNNEVFIAYNTSETTPYHKSCAEANVLNVVMDMLTLNKAKTKELYLMAGKDVKEGKQFSEDMIMPCGKCADIIGDRSTKDASIIAIPVNDGKQNITLNKSASSITELEEGQAWQFSVHDGLMKHSTIELDGDGAQQQKTASYNITSSNWRNRIISKTKNNIEKLENKADKNIAEKALYNAKTGNSVYALDLDNSPAGINNFMVGEITKAYQSTQDNGEQFPQKVRCAVIKFDDGTFSYAVEYKGEDQKATTSAEETAAFSSEQKRAKVSEIYVMEYNVDANKDNIMNTSLKEALERLYKRCNQRQGFQAHYIPFNEGDLNNDEVSKITQSFNSKEIYASAFSGVRGNSL